jgi:hypothetical protein
LRLLQTEPAVMVSIVLSRQNFVVLRIKNIGYGPAVDVNLQSDPGELQIDLAATEAGNNVIPMSKCGPFKNGISLLPPNSSLELALFPLMHGWAPSEGDFRITVTYKTATAVPKARRFSPSGSPISPERPHPPISIQSRPPFINWSIKWVRSSVRSQLSGYLTLPGECRLP